MVVDDLEHEGLFQEPHQFRAQILFSPIVRLAHMCAEVFDQGVAPYGAKRLPAVILVLGDVEAELAMHEFGEPFHIPLFGILFRRAIDVQRGLHQTVDHVAKIVFQIRPAQDGAPVMVNHLALLVHDVVVLQQLFPDIEVVALDLLLGIGDSPGDHAMFDRDTFFHAELEHQLGDPLGGEDTHQVVFQRQIES
ncbi:MAG: hypothetical protein JW395_2336 [Nitrospira sp.]|nr:hypothetical protein [Nitrospira sp.]